MGMFREIVELDHIHLISGAFPLEILATSRALFSSPVELSSLGYPSNLDALTSGQVWIIRGTNCALNMQVFFNSQRCETYGIFPFIERLGNSTLAAKIWSKLSLFTSLHFPQGYPLQAEDPNFSIFINYGKNQNSLESILLANVNVSPPSNILHVSFERLEIQIRLKFKILKKNNFSSHSVTSINTLEKNKCANFLRSASGDGRLEVDPKSFFKIKIETSKAPNITSEHDVHQNYEFDYSIEEQEMLLAQKNSSTYRGSGTKITEFNHKLLSDFTEHNNASLNCGFPNNNDCILIGNELAEKETCILVEVILNLLITGHIGQEFRGVSIVKPERRYQKAPLSKIIPSLFSSEFSLLIANNSRFLPTITNAFTKSLIRNCLSPSFQNKLLQIFSFSSIDEFEANAKQAPGLMDARLWVIVQKSLNSSATSRKIWSHNYRSSKGKLIRNPASISSKGEGDIDCEDVTRDSDQSFESLEDLLANLNDPDLLRYDQEQMLLDYETRELLISSGPPKSPSLYEAFAFEDTSEEDFMLL